MKEKRLRSKFFLGFHQQLPSTTIFFGIVDIPTKTALEGSELSILRFVKVLSKNCEKCNLGKVVLNRISKTLILAFAVVM